MYTSWNLSHAVVKADWRSHTLTEDSHEFLIRFLVKYTSELYLSTAGLSSYLNYEPSDDFYLSKNIKK